MTLLVGGLTARANAAPKDATAEPATDVGGVGDTDGYHLSIFTADKGLRPLATINPGGGSDQRWVGRQCLTGDGRTAAVMVAP